MTQIIESHIDFDQISQVCIFELLLLLLQCQLVVKTLLLHYFLLYFLLYLLDLGRVSAEVELR